MCACGGAVTDPSATPGTPDTSTALPPPEAAVAPVVQVSGPTTTTDLADVTRFPVFTDAGSIPELRVAPAPGKAEAASDRRFPLKRTQVRAELAGFAADVVVTQTFENVEARTIEAVYVFPLPENAAVYRMDVTIGGRTIAGRIEERARAKETYEAAKRAGFVAALTEQERANVFTQSIANIEPKQTIEITLRYTQRLSYDAGVHELVFPMVVGPRFVQGAPLAKPPSGTGTRADTALVPDGSRVTPPVAPAGERTGNDVSLEVVIPPDLATSNVVSVAHAVTTTKDPSGLLHVVLDAKEKLANRDFVLRYRVTSEAPRATMLVGPSGRGYFALTVDPPQLDVADLVGPRELVFVVDVSGSMRGAPLAMCKDAMQKALARLGPHDTFNVISFAGRTEKLFPASRKANTASIADAARFVDAMKAGGGTHMLDAVGAALAPDVSDGRHRYVFFMTDGFVSVEDQILRSTRRFVSEIEGRGRRAKVFGFGVGSSTNRALIETLSREGKGAAVYAQTREDPGSAVNTFYRHIDASVLRNVHVDFGGASVASLAPSTLPDLFASHPMVIYGRLDAPPSGKVSVRADSAKGPIELPVSVVRVPYDDAERQLGMFWARARVESLDADYAFGKKEVAPEITKLGKEFGILTRFTSFVAVDTSRQVAAGPTRTVAQPVEAPEGVDGPAAGSTPARPPERFRPDPAGEGSDAKPDSEEKQETLAGGRRPAAPPSDSSDDDAGSGSAELNSVGPAPRGPRGCSCRTASDDPADTTAGWLLGLLGTSIVVLRRVRRRAARDQAP